jgi:hypothetical protein
VNWPKAAATTTAELNCRKSSSGLSKAKLEESKAEDFEGFDVDRSGPNTTTVVKIEKSYGHFFSANQVLNVMD